MQKNVKRTAKKTVRVAPKTRDQILYLKNISHRSCEQIAERLNISVDTVRSIC